MKEAVADLVSIIERIHRACLTVATFPPAGPRGMYSTWPLYKLEWFDAEDFGEQRTDRNVTVRFIAPPRFMPTAREIDDALPTLALLEGFTPPTHIGGDARKAKNVIRLRAHQEWYGNHVDADDPDFAHWFGGWRAIGRMARCSHTTSRKLHAAAMHYALARVLEGSASHSEPLSKSLA